MHLCSVHRSGRPAHSARGQKSSNRCVGHHLHHRQLSRGRHLNERTGAAGQDAVSARASLHVTSGPASLVLFPPFQCVSTCNLLHLSALSFALLSEKAKHQLTASLVTTLMAALMCASTLSLQRTSHRFWDRLPSFSGVHGRVRRW